ncbi:MAG: hypothetical protein ABI812_05720 [Betaproteobacteria bacterium]
MKTTRGTRLALLAVAAVLLTAGLYGPIKRSYEARAKAEAIAELKARVESERRERTAELAANRTEILARIRGQLERREFAAAMNGAARYAAAGDPELRTLFLQAAGSESARQRFDVYRATVERGCNEASAREAFARLLAAAPDAPDSPGPLQNGALRFTHLTGESARGPVQARVRAAPQPEVHPAASAPWIERARDEHQPRLVPDYASGLLSESANAIICMWRIEGERRGTPANAAFALDLWLSAAPDGKDFIPVPLAYVDSR